ncbi:MAG: asparagine synthase-related protein [Burkholderiaceae bacterium]
MLALPPVPAEPNLGYLRNYHAQGATEWLTETAFSGICRFPAAHSAIIDLNGSGAWTSQPYWLPEINTSQERFDPVVARHYATEYLALLKDAIRIRLRSDVPLSFALSGGLDSSSIVYLARQLLAESGDVSPLSTFSTVYPSTEYQKYDESRFIDLLQSGLVFDRTMSNRFGRRAEQRSCQSRSSLREPAR